MTAYLTDQFLYMFIMAGRSELPLARGKRLSRLLRFAQSYSKFEHVLQAYQLIQLRGFGLVATGRRLEERRAIWCHEVVYMNVRCCQ